jgi:23S rRNA (adenine2503-C2)-methyltransferase
MGGTMPSPPEHAPPENAAPELAPPEPAPARPVPGELLFAAPRRGKPPRHLADLTLAERRAAVEALGEKPYRATQLSTHYFSRLVADPADMPDLPVSLRERLTTELLPPLLTPVRHLTADAGATRKSLWRLFDGALVESVLMRYPDRATVCVSSQAGCGMNCPFCATGQAGLTATCPRPRSSTRSSSGPGDGVGGGPGRARARLQRVFMGMGEPLANYNAVVRAVRRMTDPAPEGLGMSQRSITVSTVGLVPAIDRLPAEQMSVRLAVSLHAPDDELRDTLVPVNTRWKVREVLQSAWRYAKTSGRRVSIEYAMIKDINDQAWRADLLGRLLEGTSGARQPHPAQPHAGVEVDGVAAGGRARVRPPAAVARRDRDGPRHAWPRDRRRLRTAGGGRHMSDRFPRVGRLSHGYAVRQVDAYLARVESSLQAGGGSPRTTAASIRRAAFDLVLTATSRWRGPGPGPAGGAGTRARARRVGRPGRCTRRARPRAEAAALRTRIGQPNGERFRTTGMLTRGYRQADVDALLDKLGVSLSGESPSGEDADAVVGPDTVRESVFRPRRGGYDEDEVDDYLDRVVDLLLRRRSTPAGG